MCVWAGRDQGLRLSTHSSSLRHAPFILLRARVCLPPPSLSDASPSWNLCVCNVIAVPSPPAYFHIGRASFFLPPLRPEHQIRAYSHIRTSPTQCPWNTKPYSSPKPKTMASCPFSHLLYFSESCISTCDLVIYLVVQVKSPGVAPHTSSQSESQSCDAPAFTFPSVSTQPYSGPRCSSPG